MYIIAVDKGFLEQKLREDEDYIKTLAEENKMMELPADLYQAAVAKYSYHVKVPGRLDGVYNEANGRVSVYLPPKPQENVDAKEQEMCTLFGLFQSTGDDSFDEAFGVRDNKYRQPMVQGEGNIRYVYNGVDWDEYRAIGRDLTRTGKRANFGDVYKITDLADRIDSLLPKDKKSYIKTLKLGRDRAFERGGEREEARIFKAQLRQIQERNQSAGSRIYFEGSHGRRGERTYFQEGGTDGRLYFLWRGPKGIVKTYGPDVNIHVSRNDLELFTLKAQVRALRRAFRNLWKPIIQDHFRPELEKADGYEQSGKLLMDDGPEAPKGVAIGSPKFNQLFEGRSATAYMPLPDLGGDFEHYESWVDDLEAVCRSQKYVGNTVLENPATTLVDRVKKALDNNRPY